MPTAEQQKAGLAVVMAVAETIREAGEAPTGTMYAALMGKVSLEGFNKILGILQRNGLISVSGHVARWTGPVIAGVSK